MGGWDAVYNSEEGTFLGRTATSWLKILTFYAIYYTFLGFLFYGSVQVGMTRITNKDVMGKDRGMDMPVLKTRTDQPGVDAWPQNMIREDNYGQEFELGVYNKKQGAGKNEYPVYVQKITEFMLNHCPFEKKCSFDDILGGATEWKKTINFVEASEKDAVDEIVKCPVELAQSRKCLVYKSECVGTKAAEKCGKVMVINHELLKAQIADNVTGQINKPYFFIAINKVIKFQLRGYDNFKMISGLNPQLSGPSPTLQGFSVGGDAVNKLKLTPDQLQNSALVNCYPYDNTAVAGECYGWNETSTARVKTGSKIDCDNMKEQTKYKVAPIRPYILNKDYAYAGYKQNNTEAENQKVATYAKPFAMFQMSLTDPTKKINNFADKTLIRCNVIAKNIEYPYLANKDLMGNALLAQPGHGWVQLGFSQKVNDAKWSLKNDHQKTALKIFVKNSSII